MGKGRIATVALLAVVAAPATGGTAAAGPRMRLANRCFVVRSVAAAGFVRAAGEGYAASAHRRKGAARFYLKPTGLRTYMAYDGSGRLLATGDGAAVTRAGAGGPAAEWSIWRLRRRTSYRLRSTAKGRVLAIDAASRALVTADRPGRPARFRLVRAHGCRRFPEATLSARGTTFRPTRRDGTVVGFADPHLHITADMRAGGRVVHGMSFARFGIADALGHDEDDHGPDGSADVTGNLLRTGSPAGTHDTHGWPSFAGWPVHDTFTHQQVYYRWLQRAWVAGERLVVAQTVEDQPLCETEPLRSHSCDETEAVALQARRLRRLRDYVDAQSGGPGRGWFRLVYTPRAARRAIERGKLAVLIGVESSNPFGCSEYRGAPQCDRSGIDRGIRVFRRLGVRSLFPAHWVDNALTGAAIEGGSNGEFIGALNVRQTGEFFKTGPCPHPEQGEEVQPAGPEVLTLVLGQVPESIPVYPPGRQCNARGLTRLGEYAIRRLMDNHMLIEVDHMSERARQRVLAIAEERHYPLVSSHTDTGGKWVPSELRRLYAVGGFAAARVDDAARLPAKILSFRRYRRKGLVGVGLGTDTGGFNALPGPAADAKRNPLPYPFRAFRGKVWCGRQRTGTRTYDLNVDGMAHYGLLPDLLADARRRRDGRRALGLLFHSAEAYLRTWELAARE
ncbi:MAG: hypothetical protein QOG41_2522 [Thermoleophilaceae bacterium]|nr:hypothetical protein [Thermoleophilaceae bacterium]